MIDTQVLIKVCFFFMTGLFFVGSAVLAYRNIKRLRAGYGLEAGHLVDLENHYTLPKKTKQINKIFLIIVTLIELILIPVSGVLLLATFSI